MRKLKATIIITNYNYGKYLEQSIMSALDQTYPETEIIVVDDGSIDNSVNVISKFKNVITAILKENGGQGSAFNAGYRESHGDVIFFLDADDFLLPTAVQNVINYFQDETINKVHWPLHIVNSNGSLTGELTPKDSLPEGSLFESVIMNGPDYTIVPTSGNA